MFRWPQMFKRRPSKVFDERRKFLRLDTSIPARYSIIPKDKEEEIEQHKLHRAEAKNIGGGGLLVEIPVLTEELLLTTHLIKVKFALPDEAKSIEAIARMVCVEKPEGIEGFHLRLKFIRITSEDKQRLINYVMLKHKKRPATQR
jgi:c-di-GMP-binding flagellar brake protein YcgR